MATDVKTQRIIVELNHSWWGRDVWSAFTWEVPTHGGLVLFDPFTPEGNAPIYGQVHSLYFPAHVIKNWYVVQTK